MQRPSPALASVGRMNVAGLPLHPLVIHAAVALTPLAAALVIWFAVAPGWRWLTRWPAAVTALLALAAVWVATISGNALLRARHYLLTSPQLAEKIHVHQSRGNILLYLMVGFVVLTVLGTWSLGGRSALASGRGTRESQLPALDAALRVALVVAAVVVVVWVVLTGDAGARAVWGV